MTSVNSTVVAKGPSVHHYAVHYFLQMHHLIHEVSEWLGHALVAILVFGMVTAGKTAVVFQVASGIREFSTFYDERWQAQLAIVALGLGVGLALYETIRKVLKRHQSRPHAHGTWWHYADVFVHGMVHLWRSGVAWTGKLSLATLLVAVLASGKLILIAKVAAIFKGLFVLYEGWESNVAMGIVALGLGIALWRTSQKLSKRQRAFEKRHGLQAA